ncbi:murein hydrolase activator EnvC [Candidatus Symbiopectobacterium sp. 'North America']|uniref:murein hydrolase activator EnvC n=1 Tax=Candidatus Symbiopectobacterium sp. 'North America' TaxID=2794574 RepID=UPI0018C8F853|nr:murein hydrolase activator EnvC [Candidatus Symbiopectobacterium sp. 'North America']MBG6246197.1 murein hydrolase activator EnvC [Candidatus Symbiopectobacterium sp. 'North America']
MNKKASVVSPRVPCSVPAQGSNTGKSPLHALLAICISAVCVGAFTWPTLGLGADNQQQLKTLQQDIAEKEKRVQEQKQQRSTLLNQLQQQEQSIARASRQLRDTTGTLATLSEELKALATSITKLENQRKQQEALLARQLDAAFRQGQHNGLQLILRGEESQRSERILAYFGYLNEARQQNIAELQHTRTELTAQKRQVEQKQATQKTLLAEQQTQQKALEQARGERKQTLSTLESSLEKDRQQLTELRQNKARLRDQIARAEREAKARAEREAREAAKVREREEQAKLSGSRYQPSESERSLMARTGGLGQPAGQAIWPVRGRVEHRFGEPLQGELRWKGLMIAAPEGTDVKAIADGTVLMADWLQGYGLVVVLQHGKGDMSLYGYNQSALVSVGAQVKAGQPIALVGTSGGQSQPVLYFEIRRQGQAVNPQPWLGK